MQSSDTKSHTLESDFRNSGERIRWSGTNQRKRLGSGLKKEEDESCQSLFLVAVLFQNWSILWSGQMVLKSSLLMEGVPMFCVSGSTKKPWWTQEWAECTYGDGNSQALWKSLGEKVAEKVDEGSQVLCGMGECLSKMRRQKGLRCPVPSCSMIKASDIETGIVWLLEIAGGSGSVVSAWVWWDVDRLGVVFSFRRLIVDVVHESHFVSLFFFQEVLLHHPFRGSRLLDVGDRRTDCAAFVCHVCPARSEHIVVDDTRKLILYSWQTMCWKMRRKTMSFHLGFHERGSLCPWVHWWLNCQLSSSMNCDRCLLWWHLRRRTAASQFQIVRNRLLMKFSENWCMLTLCRRALEKDWQCVRESSGTKLHFWSNLSLDHFHHTRDVGPFSAPWKCHMGAQWPGCVKL